MGFWSAFAVGQGVRRSEILGTLEQDQASGTTTVTLMNDPANQQARITDQLKVFGERGFVEDAAWSIVIGPFRSHARLANSN